MAARPGGILKWITERGDKKINQSTVQNDMKEGGVDAAK
jgi:hypothetical protein